MAHSFNNIRPIAGMNMDDEVRVLPEGDYRFALNLRNSIGDSERMGITTNVQGNWVIASYNCPYNGTPDSYPTGINKCIGSVEDAKNHSIVYFLWNENNNHGIYRYWRDRTDALNPYGIVEQIVQYDFGWSQDERITSASLVYGATGDLCYWTDSVMPRKINLTKGNTLTEPDGTAKIKCWDVYLPENIIDISVPDFSMDFYDFSGALLGSVNIDVPPPPPAPAWVTVSANANAQFSPAIPALLFYTNSVFFDSLPFQFQPNDVFTITGASIPANNQTYHVLYVTQNQVVVQELVTLSLTDSFVTVSMSQQGSPPVDERSRSKLINAIADTINFYLPSLVEAKACDCHLELCEKVSGTIWTTGSSLPQILMPAKNWYGATLIDRFFDRCKYPFLSPPIMLYEKDESFPPNYVKNRVFQSRLQPRYDDNEGTDLTLGVWSQVPINNIACGGNPNKDYNFIDINFNDDTIANEQTLVLLKKITLVMCEHNSGLLIANRSILEIEPCDFLDYDYANSKWVCHYKFYNDIISSPVNDALAAKLFDDIPLKSDAELYVKNKLVDAGILEGYDAPDCIDATHTIDFSNVEDRKLHKITGKIRILTYSLSDGMNNVNQQPPTIHTQSKITFYNLFPQYQKYPFYVPPSGLNSGILRGGIFIDTSRVDNKFPFYGGGGFGIGAGYDFGIKSGMEDKFDQRIPEGGFPVYAAGTNYLTVSKQKNIGKPLGDFGALDTSDDNKKSAIGAYYAGGGDEYSEFELLVPDGTYVIRLASHWCSFADDAGEDKLGFGFMYNLSSGLHYQKTSTNVSVVIDAAGNFLPQKEITIVVAGGDVDCGTFVVNDLAPPYDTREPEHKPTQNNYRGAYWQPICGYLISSDKQSTDMNNPDFTGLPVEKTIVCYGVEANEDVNMYIAAGATWVSQNNLLASYGDCAVTDHNGYWFGIGGTYYNPDSFSGGGIGKLFSGLNIYPISAFQCSFWQPAGVRKIRDRNNLIYVGTYSQYYNHELVPTTFNTDDDGSGTWNLIHGFYTVDSYDARDTSMTYVQGKVVNQFGDAIENVQVVYQTGETAITQQNGTFSIKAWNDMISPNYGIFPSVSYSLHFQNQSERIVDDIILTANPLCETDIQSLSPIPVLIRKYGQVPSLYIYNKDFSYTLQDIRITELVSANSKYHKRGGNYSYAIRLYDVAGRFCSVVKAMDVYVPFITEDLNKTFPNQYPPNTFRYGTPTINYSLSTDTVFPSWVYCMQWMRTKNSVYGNYLQWICDGVKYIASLATDISPEIDTSYQNGDATSIRISIKNIVDYFSENNDSHVGYTYQTGDRLRLISDRDSSHINGLKEFEITSYDAGTSELIIKPIGYQFELKSGTLIEIFNPKSVATTDEQIYYEVGEFVKVNNGIPEKYSGTFNNGDTYWRRRITKVGDSVNGFTMSYSSIIEDASVSDFYLSKDEDIGRIGIIDPNFKQIYNPSKLRVSNSYQESSSHNGLSSMEELNVKELDKVYGAIKKLAFVNNNLVCVMENKEVSNYIGLVTLMQASRGADAGLIATSADFFGTEYVHKQMLGTDFAGSIAISNAGIMFGLNSNSASAWKYTEDEQVISDAKMINYFVKLGNDGVTDCIATYDRWREEYVITVWRKQPDGTSIPETLAWNDIKKRWTTFYSFTPECYGQLGTELFSFQYGGVWIHDKSPVYNMFYFQEYESKLKLVFNQEPDKVKVWNACALKAQQANGKCDWNAPIITNNNGQLSRLKKSFTKKEEFFYAPFKRDLNTVAVADPIINGRALRSTSLTVELENDYNGEIRLYSFDANYTLSERTSK